MLNGKALHYVDNSNVLWREINYLHNDALHDIEIQRMLMTQLLPVTVKAWLDYFQYKKKKNTPQLLHASSPTSEPTGDLVLRLGVE